MRPVPEEHDLDFIYDPDDFEEVVTCTKCGAYGSELLTWCPGEHLSKEARDACYEGGNVEDLERWRREHGKPPSPIFGDEEAEGWE